MTSLANAMFSHLRQTDIDKVKRIGQKMANEKGAVFMSDVILEIFFKGLEAMEE